MWEQACIRASQSEDTRSGTHPQSNTLQTNRTHQNSQVISSLQQAAANCCLVTPKLGVLVHDMPVVSLPPRPLSPPSQWRWRYVSVWISQWIYYHSLSGPVCQACDPGSGQPSCWATWTSVSSSATCFNMLEWYLTANADAAGKVSITVKMKLLWQQLQQWGGIETNEQRIYLNHSQR